MAQVTKGPELTAEQRAATKKEVEFKAKYNLPADAYRLPASQDLYFSNMSETWPNLCKDSKAPMRNLEFVTKALLTVTKDVRYSNIFISEPEIDFATGKPKSNPDIFAYGINPNDASDLFQTLFLVYSQLIKDYVLTDKNKGRMMVPNNITEDQIRTVYEKIKPQTESKTREKPEERSDSSPTSIG